MKRLTKDTISNRLKTMKYAVRGSVVIAAERIHKDISNPLTKSSHPFSNIIYTNVGNPQSLGQPPLTWPRQVMALSDLPDALGVDHPNVNLLFPHDAISRARQIKQALGGHGTGAYTHSQGPSAFRKEIALFIEKRDNLPSGSVSCDSIFMTNGASAGIHMLLTALIADYRCGVMIPIPQYPIYSATIDLLGGRKVAYFLDERKGWDMNIEELERSINEARKKGTNVNSFVLINPNNPTGQVLPKKSVIDIVNFCVKHNLVLLADEVYQENVYDESVEFFSCKRAAHETKNLTSLELVSFHSTSKGLFGECGRRGGYMELSGFDDYVKDSIYKLASSSLCSNIPGQVMTSLMVNGPKPTDSSYENHEKEKLAIFESLKRRAKIACDGFNSIDGIECHKPQGAMYCFPKILLPDRAFSEAISRGITVDTLYALSLLEKTGVCVVPACGFGQEKGRVGFRTTFLPLEKEMTKVISAVKDHHKYFCKKYLN